MSNQVLTIEPPSELKFKGSFAQGTTTYMRLINPSKDTILFKIKTTAPKKYCVRPNSGFLEPDSVVDIAITPQPIYVDQNDKHKHKFMVQSIIATGDKINIDQVWKEVSPDQMMEYKLKCVFDFPHGTNLNDSGDAGNQNEVTKKRVAVSEEFKPSTAKDAVDIADAKSKKSEDHNVASTSSAATKSDITDNMQKAVTSTELTQLKEEENKLRHENLQLKEELLRLRQASGDGRMMRAHSYSPAKQEQQSMMPWLATAIGMAILGFIIGKFIIATSDVLSCEWFVHDTVKIVDSKSSVKPFIRETADMVAPRYNNDDS